MPIKFTNNHVCEKCHKSFEWNYFETKRCKLNSDEAVVEIVPNVTMAHSFFKNSETGYEVEVNCPYCFYDNHFTYNENK